MNTPPFFLGKKEKKYLEVFSLYNVSIKISFIIPKNTDII